MSDEQTSVSLPADSPLTQPVPADLIERVHRLARDLAWGVSNKQWGVNIPWNVMGKGWYAHLSATFAIYVEQTWGGEHPPLDMLEPFGYVTYREIKMSFMAGTQTINQDQRDYVLTEKAFALLAKPNTPPSVFISYRRAESSAFGLLIVARLKAAGVPNPFIDMNIEPGAEWNAHLQQVVQHSRYFILLIAPTTLASENIQDEIKWARAAGVTILPVLHNGARAAELPPELASKQVIVISHESAEQYELAMIKLLNRFGYTP
jgi:TIR domain